MGCNPPCLLPYRLRLLLFFTLCLTVVGWATSNYFVGPIQVIPKAKDFMASFHKVIPLGKEEALAHDVIIEKAELDSCPSVSPNLSKCLPQPQEISAPCVLHPLCWSQCGAYLLVSLSLERQ